MRMERLTELLKNRYGRIERKTISVRRGMVAQDGFAKLADADLKALLVVKFVDQFGQEE
jgi:ubiquitin-protein ligase E3 C